MHSEQDRTPQGHIGGDPVIPAMFTDTVDSMDAVHLFKLLWAVCDFNESDRRATVDAMRDGSVNLDRLIATLRAEGCIDDDMHPTVKGLETWVGMPVRFVETIRLSNGMFLSGARVRGAIDCDLQDLLGRMGCFWGTMGLNGPSVDGANDHDVEMNSVWMIGYSRMDLDDVLVLFTHFDQRTAVDRCIYAALELASGRE